MASFGAYILCFCVNVIMALVQFSTASEAPDLASLCPYSDFCTGEAKELVPSASGMQSCCQTCSCAADCDLVGNCCPDHPNNSRLSGFPKYRCQTLNSVLNIPRNIYSFAEDDISFHIIDSCPEQILGVDFSACEIPIKFEDYIIVSDKVNEKIFKNRHCALCHGVSEVIEWDLVAMCPEIMTRQFQTFDERDSFVWSTCVLHARPPNQRIREMATCYPEFRMISDCSDTVEKQENGYADYIRKACLRTGRPSWNTIVRKDSKVYSNVFCYLCNNPNATDAGFCPIPEEVATNSVEVPFYGILKTAVDDQPSGVKQCKSAAEVWDSFASTCRTLYCPFGKIPVNGVCMDSMVYAEGYTVFLLFEITPVRDSAFSITEDSLKDIETRVRWLLEINSTCGICKPDIFQEHSRTFLRLHMYTKASCSMSSLVEHARSLVQRNENLTLFYKNTAEEQELAFILTFTTEKMTFVGRIENQLSIGQRCMHPSTQIDLFILQNCPRVLVPVEEFLSKQENNTSSLDPAGLISVCVESYPKMASIVSGAALRQPLKMLSVALLLFLLFTLNV